MRQYQLVIEYLKQANILYDEIGDRQKRGSVLARLGEAYHSLGYYAEAIDAYRMALTMDFDDVFCHNNLAGIYLKVGQLDEAGHHYQQLAVRPEDAFIAHVNLGIIARRQGQEVEAKKLFEIALTGREEVAKQQLKSPADYLELRALAFLGVGQVEQALATLQAALEHRQRVDTIDFTLYNLLAAAPNPPQGLDEMCRLLLDAVKKASK